ncbi:MAG: preprotein translocase subunit SecE [Myxococcota bacterium]
MKARSSWLVAFFGMTGLVSALVLHLALTSVFRWLGVSNTPVLGPNFTLSHAVGAASALGIVVFFGLVHKPSRLFIEESFVELDKVAWPTWPQTKSATWTVIATSVLASLVLGVFDALFAKLTSGSLFGG